MPEVEVKLSAVKCPICDFNHNFVVNIEYVEKNSSPPAEQAFYHNLFITEEKVDDKIIKVPVFEIDGFCTRTNTPFRVIVDPKIPTDSIPTKFTISTTP